MNHKIRNNTNITIYLVHWIRIHLLYIKYDITLFNLITLKFIRNIRYSSNCSNYRTDIIRHIRCKRSGYRYRRVHIHLYPLTPVMLMLALKFSSFTLDFLCFAGHAFPPPSNQGWSLVWSARENYSGPILWPEPCSTKALWTVFWFTSKAWNLKYGKGEWGRPRRRSWFVKSIFSCFPGEY